MEHAGILKDTHIMKPVSSLSGLALLATISASCFAADDMTPMMHHDGMSHGNMRDLIDTRISLNLSAEMKQHQLRNMRSHLEAVQTITGLLAKRKFDQAAQIAHARLGLSAEMKKTCGMFGNEKFEKLGLAFHNSGDALGDALSTRNLDKSLQALNVTMGYCVRCHATYRQ
jgi:cytochrome c556